MTILSHRFCKVASAICLAITLTPCLLTFTSAASPVAVGKGSYASDIPDNAPDGLRKMDDKPANLVVHDGLPIPTNKWWTNLLLNRETGRLWVFPWEVETDQNGINLAFPDHWNSAGSDPQLDPPVRVGGVGYSPSNNSAKSWGDWSLTFRQAADTDHYIDVTLGRGMPTVWFEFHGVQPTVTFPDQPQFFNDDGAATVIPASGDHLGIESAGKHYGLFVPKGTSFTIENNVLTLHFAGQVHTAVLCALPQASDLAVFDKYTDSIPRDTKMSWVYDPASGKVNTIWSIQTELFRGDEKQLIQGWLPHHYREGVPAFPFNKLLKGKAGTPSR